jgi:hypothetical protein
MKGARVGRSEDGATGVPATAFADAHAKAALSLDRGELGQFTLHGSAGVGVQSANGGRNSIDLPVTLAVGVSPSVRDPKNAEANAALKTEPALQKRVTIVPEPSAKAEPAPYDLPPLSPDAPLALPAIGAKKATAADVLEAIHKATGQTVIGDYYTRLYAPDAVTVRDVPLFEALSRLSDTMRLRWSKDGDWLRFRSTGFFHDRLKEVPNRLLARWAESRRVHKTLRLDDLLEIAQLPDAQLQSQHMAEGARSCTAWSSGTSSGRAT